MASTPPPDYVRTDFDRVQWAAGHARRVQDRARETRRSAEYERKVSVGHFFPHIVNDDRKKQDSVQAIIYCVAMHPEDARVAVMVANASQ